MTEHAGYAYEIVRQDPDFSLLRGRSDGRPAIFALIANGEHPPARNVQRLTHEHALAPYLEPKWAACPFALTRHEGRQMLLLEGGDGEPLDIVLARAGAARFDLGRLLALACNLARTLGHVHRQGIVHKDIKPANVIVDATGQVRLMGFGIASRLRTERMALEPPEIIAGTFAYMAPEQTGRMNRSIDTRSDLYALGVTLYEMFTGALPFSVTEPLEWIHCHVARAPAPPSERQNSLPAALDPIVLKLLAKNPEDRYHTAFGVEADLRSCLAAWSSNGRIDPFEIGRADFPDRFLIPEKLYGRANEIDVLVKTSERVMDSGKSEMVLISGYAGIGKSSIVSELHKALVPRQALFASGKFDQYKRDVPYATLAQAFQGLVRQLLSRPDAELGLWRSELQAALGPNAQLMVDLIPDLALVIGDQPTVPELDAKAARARFHVAFRGLVGVFAQPSHPLVLFIDDLQWLDRETLEVIERLVTDPQCRHVLVIGAFRDGEVTREHPLSSTLAAIRSAGGVVTDILLHPLAAGDLAQLLADALGTVPDRVRKLANLVVEKTAGNPFFAIQFITALTEEGLLAFDADSRAWQWDIERIRTRGITDNAALLMSTRLNRQPANAREILGQLACLGNGADIRTVAVLEETSPEAIETLLAGAVDDGLIFLSNGACSFTHDHVQAAAYELIPPEERSAAHLRIARALLATTPPAMLDDKVFEIANQFGRAAAALNSTEERERVADLDLAAGKRAMRTSAYRSAQTYLAAGRTLLGEDGWQSRYALTFELERSLAECEIVVGELTGAEQRLSTLSARAVGVTDQAAAVCLAVLLYFNTGRHDCAVDSALKFLAPVDAAWSPRPTETAVREEYQRLRNNLAGRPIDGLLDAPPMSDPVRIATMAVLTELFPAAYAVDRYLLELVLLRMANLSLEHGICESSSVAFSALNMALGSHFADYTTAFGLGELACRLVERRDADRFKARVYSCFAAFTMPWNASLSTCEPLMRQAFEIGSRMGDRAFAAYNLRNLITHLLVSGMPLRDVEREAEQTLAYASELQLGLSAELFIAQLSLIRKLRGDAVDPEPEAWTAPVGELQPGLAMMFCYDWLFRMQERLLAGEIAEALDAAARIEPVRWAMRSSVEEAEYDFYAALTFAAAADSAPADQRDVHLASLHRHFERIALSAANCPENFADRKALVGAEIARLENRTDEAQRLYEEAVVLSRRQGFVQIEAIANELAGAYYAARGLGTVADAYLRNARDGFERWGAQVKVQQLEERYPQLRRASLPHALAGMVDTSVVQLDVKTVDKASQTLSSEMALPSLLEKLMRLAVEHAGAERGLLVILRGDEAYIEARATTGRGTVDVTLESARVTPMDLPQSVLHLVLRTGERLVLDDGSAKGLDAGDEYVRRNRPRSVLCLPIFKQTKVIGVLYLENNLTPRAFTADRVAVLDFLASQAAIWLENARLYSDLRRSEAWLREAQHLSSTGSWYWRVSRDILEFSEQACAIYQMDPDETITLDLIASRIHPEDLHLMLEMVDIARGPARDVDYFFRARMPDQSIKYLHLVAHGSRDKDGEFEFIGAVQDVTRHHLAEEALGKARSELAHVSRVTSLGVLTASIAHEVNQPLLGIVTNASTCLRMLSSDPPNIEGARRTAERSIRDGHRAADVIVRLRALFGNQHSTTDAVDLNEVAREVIALSSSELQRGRVCLQTELACNLPPVMGDRVQLQQVMLNLLLNASDAMEAIDDRPRKLVVRTAFDEGEGVRFSVQDEGVGLPPEGMDRLFEAFYTTKAGGMGMGLSVSHSIIQEHRGRLWAAANAGPGATFSFLIPSVPAPESDRQPAPGSTP
jgi:predicted ATPase/signal transduction histidine kinase